MTDASPFDQRLQALLDQQLREQEQFDQQFRGRLAEMGERLETAHGDLLASAKANRAVSPEIGQIVALLNQNPYLIPHVRQYVEQLIVRIKTAIDELLKVEG